MWRIITFAIVGIIGFLIDGGLVTLLVEIINVNAFISRAISFPVAVTATWYLNRRLTFATDASVRKKTEYARYVIIQIIGSAINLTIYVLLIITIPSLAVHPVLPLAAGSLVAMTFNFLGAQLFVFQATSSRT
jgi:putative flippase GtrA